MVLRTRQQSTCLIEIYLHDQEGLSERNLAVLSQVASFVTSLSMPFIMRGDFNLLPIEFSECFFLGSTGSIGKTLINLILSNKNNFDVVLLTANKNYKTLLKQAEKLNVKNIIITNKNKYEILKRKTRSRKIKIYNTFTGTL